MKMANKKRHIDTPIIIEHALGQVHHYPGNLLSLTYPKILKLKPRFIDNKKLRGFEFLIHQVSGNGPRRLEKLPEDFRR